MKQDRILVIRGGAIGDFILTLPALAALRRQFPQAHLEVLGYPHIAQLALAGGLADELRSIESRALAGFFARNGELDESLGRYFAGFALIVSYLYDPDGIFQANVARCSRAQFIAAPHRPDETANQHATDVFLKPLERLAIYDADPVPRLDLISPTDVALSSGPWLALHPGSGSERKNWPEENWLQLAARLVESTDFNLLIVGGEAEEGRCERLRGSAPADRVRLARNLPLSELAHWLKQCAGFIGHDSGISHLAAALGVRVLVLWGDTNEAIWRPRSGRVALLRHAAGLGELPVGTVLQQSAGLVTREKNPQ